jgi:hypothetical protein
MHVLARVHVCAGFCGIWHASCSPIRSGLGCPLSRIRTESVPFRLPVRSAVIGTRQSAGCGHIPSQWSRQCRVRLLGWWFRVRGTSGRWSRWADWQPHLRGAPSSGIPPASSTPPRHLRAHARAHTRRKATRTCTALSHVQGYAPARGRTASAHARTHSRSRLSLVLHGAGRSWWPVALAPSSAR